VAEVQKLSTATSANSKSGNTIEGDTITADGNEGVSSSTSGSMPLPLATAQEKSENIEIRYICFKKFTEQQSERLVVLDACQSNLQQLTQKIKEQLGLNLNTQDVVLYRSEGYPLSPSESAMKGMSYLDLF